MPNAATIAISDRRPFLSAPEPKRYFAAAAIEEARQRIGRAIARHEGPAMLIGAAGCGKSLLLAVLAEQFAGRRAVVTLQGGQLCTRRALLQSILSEIDLAFRGMDESELRLALVRHLRGEGTAGRRLLVLVDEADSLPVRLLEELRVLTNVAAEGLPLVSVVLAGGPGLEERFADPQLDSFSQRIAARCYLAPMGRDETMLYVRSQVAAVGFKPETLFAADALAAIHAATGGVPRLVNQLGDQLVWMVEETGCTPLDATLVQQAWSDLQQLPAPWNVESQSSASAAPASSSIVEYGELDGDASSGPHLASHEPRLVEYGELDGDDAVRLVEGPTVHFGDADAAELEFDDEPPASIPIAAARGPHAAQLGNIDAAIDATEDLLESLDHLETGDAGAAIGGHFPQEFVGAAITPSQPEARLTPFAENPFDEPFDDEEAIVDHYAVFETELLKVAPHVLNRADRAFAADLGSGASHLAESRKPQAPVPTSGDQNMEVGRQEKLRPSVTRPATRGHETEATRGAYEVAISAPAPGDVPSTSAAALNPFSTLQPPASSLKPLFGEILLLDDDDRPAAAVVPGRHFRRLFSTLEQKASRSLSG